MSRFFQVVLKLKKKDGEILVYRECHKLKEEHEYMRNRQNPIKKENRK